MSLLSLIISLFVWMKHSSSFGRSVFSLHVGLTQPSPSNANLILRRQNSMTHCSVIQKHGFKDQPWRISWLAMGNAYQRHYLLSFLADGCAVFLRCKGAEGLYLILQTYTERGRSIGSQKNCIETHSLSEPRQSNTSISGCI